MVKNYCFVFLIVTSLLCIGEGLKLKPRIINAYSSQPSQFPYFAFLVVLQNNQIKRTCGGTLMNNRWILTAASCLHNADEVAVHLGETEIYNNYVNGNRTVVSPRNFRIANEIALIKLTKPVTFSERIESVKLSKTCETEGLNVIAIGNSKWNRLAAVLQWAPMKTVGRKECEIIYPFIHDFNYLICAVGDHSAGIGTNDFGGPLIRADTRELIGIAAHLNPDKRDAFPQGFINIHN